MVWALDQPKESVTRPGDSGGPIFYCDWGKRYLAGVTSSGHTDLFYGMQAEVMRVDAYASWIDTTIRNLNSNAPSVTVGTAMVITSAVQADAIRITFRSAVPISTVPGKPVVSVSWVRTDITTRPRDWV